MLVVQTVLEVTFDGLSVCHCRGVEHGDLLEATRFLLLTLD